MNDLTEKVNTLVTSAKSKKGPVAEHKGRSVLVGAYDWTAGLCHLVEDHYRKEDPKHEWCTVECFARFRYGSAIASHVKRARSAIAAMAAPLMRHGEFLILSYDGPNGAKNAMRLLRSTDDWDVVAAQIERMIHMRDTTTEKAEVALAVVRNKQRLRQLAEAEQDDTETE